MPLLRLTSRSPLAIGSAISPVYVAARLGQLRPSVRYASGSRPGIRIPALSFALILLFGVRFVPWLVIAPLFADIIAARPAGAGRGRNSDRSHHRADIRRRRDDPAVAAPAIRSHAFVAAVAAGADGGRDRQHCGGVVRACVRAAICSTSCRAAAISCRRRARAFVGDLIGVMVFTPFLLIVFTRRALPALSWEVAARGRGDSRSRSGEYSVSPMRSASSCSTCSSFRSSGSRCASVSKA